MTTIRAKVVADSISPQGIRLTTVEMRYPRIIHSELLTHRVFSRNARSSRAVPVKTIIQEVIDDPFIPLHWGKNQKGMQAHEETSAPVLWPHPLGDDYPKQQVDRCSAWLHLRDEAVKTASAFADAGYHKQIVNRILEPFAHIDVLVTSTSWANFFALRDHPDAEPHIAALAREVRAAMDSSSPDPLKPGEWHLPYVSGTSDIAAVVDYLRNVSKIMPRDDRVLEVYKKLSVARSARISYKPFDGDSSIEKELERYDLLVGSVPLHASPAEHQATPDETRDGKWKNPRLHGNFRGWVQNRKTLPGEYHEDSVVVGDREPEFFDGPWAPV